MAHYGALDAATTVEEQPDHNLYVTTLSAHGRDERVGEIRAVVNTMTYNADEIDVHRIVPDALDDFTDEELLQIAEIEMNKIPGLPMYVLLTVGNPV